MIAAVSPTSASSRSGTPAPRSARACKPPIRVARSLAGPLDTTETVRHLPKSSILALRRRCRLGDQASGVHAEHFGDALDADRAGSQDAWGDSGQIDDRRG